MYQSEAEAWRDIAQVFDLYGATGIAPVGSYWEAASAGTYGICHAISMKVGSPTLGSSRYSPLASRMDQKVKDEVVGIGKLRDLGTLADYSAASAELRATLAYLFAEEAASAGN